MTDNVLRSRRSTAVAVTEPDAAALEVRMKHANAIAAAKSAIPATYQNNPGAVMLAQEWATARGVDLLTTMQTVAFISGKPVIDATMQRALAMRAGYEVEIGVTDKSATCTLSRDGKPCGSSTYTVEDAKTAGLAGKDNWKKNPKAMLVARATSQTMRWHAPDVMVGVFTEDEVDDPVDTLNPVPVVEVEGQQTLGDVVDAEIVEGGGAESVESSPAALTDAPKMEIADLTEATWNALVSAGADLSDDQRADLDAWLGVMKWSIKRSDLDEGTALEVIAWIGRRS